jgi:iron complex outermembrane recepter protein
VPGIGFDRDKVPAMVQTLPAEDFSRVYSPDVTKTLEQRVPGVFVSDTQGNEFTPDLRYRGFAASPLQGTPQGLAVYMQGIRVNEAFGDTVNWDLIPTIAIGRADVWTNNPAFGLNALGGAISLQMKDGFTYRGTEFDASGGSYGRLGGWLQYGIRNGEWGLYLAAQGVKDDGWRYQSPSRIARFYGDLGWKGTDAEVHLVASTADNFFGVIGPTPVELLNNDYRSIFTWPQTTRNQAQLLALNGRYAVTDHWTVQSNLYLRKFDQAHVDGNGAEIERCSGNPANPLFNTLCLENNGFPTQPQANFQIFNANNQAINCPPGNGNTCATTPWGTVDRTFTNALTTGGTLQATSDNKIFGHDNYFTIGASIDHSKINFQASSELGYIFPDLFVGPNAAIPASGQIIHTAANIGFSPVNLDAQNTYYGFYGNETFNVTNRLALTAGGRYNLAKIVTADVLGTSPDINGNFTFSRFNPVVGLTYKILPEMTFYTGYSEANRAPTPLELGCSNPQKPCLLEGFLVSDPPLQQVVARTKEAGLRGNVKVNGGGLDWKLGLFRTDSQNDIIEVSSTIQGRGVFQNVPGTRRQGLEAGAQYQAAPWLFYANYALVDATYQFAGKLASPNNPSADADGNVFVTPGKHIPGIPLHQIKGGVDYAVTPALKLGTDVIWVSSQWYIGDQANQNVKLADYWFANLHGSYQLTNELQVYGVVNNLFNRKFATFGTYFDPQAIANALPNPPTDHRMVTPAQPLSIYVGLRGKLDPAAPLVDKGVSLYKAPTLTAWTWAGPYLGGNVGHGWGKSNANTVLSDATNGTPLLATNTPGTLNGMGFGGQAGFNWQSGPWVAGIEVDGQQSQQRGRATMFNCAGATCNPTASASGLDAPVTTSMAQRLEWFGTLRARLGATPTPDSLIYATGGLAVGRIKTSGTISGSGNSLTQSVTQSGTPVVAEDVTPGVDNGGDDDDDNNSSSVGTPSVGASVNPVSTSFTSHTTKVGWAIGAGAEVRLAGNWTGKIEYLYLDFGNVSTTASLPANLTPLAFNFNSHVTESFVRVGLNYKFDPLGAVYEAPKGLKGPTLYKAPTPPTWTWAGLYLGVNVGYGWGKSSTDTVFSDATTGASLLATVTSAALKGVIFGGQAGFNWQSGPWVVGIEGDAQQGKQRGQATTFNCAGATCNSAASAFGLDAPVTASMAQRLEWFRTLRARLGRSLTPDFMVYVTGGLAVGRINTSGTISGSSLTVTQGVTPSVIHSVEQTVMPGVGGGGGDDEDQVSADIPVETPVDIPVNIPFVTASINPVSSQFTSHTTKVGWAIGAGAEVRLGGNWTGKVEYLYLDFGNVSTIASLPTNSTPLAINFDSRVTDHVVRVGVNYKFDPNEIWAN